MTFGGGGGDICNVATFNFIMRHVIIVQAPFFLNKASPFLHILELSSLTFHRQNFVIITPALLLHKAVRRQDDFSNL